MSNASNTDMDFTDQLESIILENLSNEQFGVSELAEIMNMSRSNLLRKIRKNTQLSASLAKNNLVVIKNGDEHTGNTG